MNDSGATSRPAGGVKHWGRALQETELASCCPRVRKARQGLEASSGRRETTAAPSAGPWETVALADVGAQSPEGCNPRILGSGSGGGGAFGPWELGAGAGVEAEVQVKTGAAAGGQERGPPTSAPSSRAAKPAGRALQFAWMGRPRAAGLRSALSGSLGARS